MKKNFKKHLLFLFLALLSLTTSAQFFNVTGSAQKDATTGKFRWNFGLNGLYEPLSLSDFTIPGGPISSLPTVGFDPGTNISLKQWIVNSFYQSQPPTAAISGGATTMELGIPGSTTTVSLTWTAGRQAATAPLASIVVAGISQSFSQPAQNSSIGGTQTGVVLTRNNNTSWSNVVTTTDGKTATAIASVSFLPKRYWGRTSNATPDISTVLAAAGGSSELSSAKAKGSFTIIASGSNLIFYAYPSNLGDLTAISIGGFDSFSAFTKNVVSITNAAGYTQNYNIYVSNNTFSGDATNIVTN